VSFTADGSKRRTARAKPPVCPRKTYKLRIRFNAYRGALSRARGEGVALGVTVDRVLAEEASTLGVETPARQGAAAARFERPAAASGARAVLSL
jgi:hypothetical protein